KIVELHISVVFENLLIDIKYELNGKKQSHASKTYKLKNSSNSAVSNRPDIMFTIKISKNYLESLYVESGRY
ncbi:2853_t:CDS:2, partial [Gigaspora margarita]